MAKEIGVRQAGNGGGWIEVHPLVVRVTHWINVLAVLIMITSGCSRGSVSRGSNPRKSVWPRWSQKARDPAGG